MKIFASGSFSKNKVSEVKKHINQFKTKKKQKGIEKVARNFGLNPDIKYIIILMTSEEKAVFNYLSSEVKPNLRKLKILSGRAISSKKIPETVLTKIKESKSNNALIRLTNTIIKQMDKGNEIIILGIPKVGKVEPFERLLAHEVYHLILFKEGLFFGGINKKYEYIDEGLAIMLSYCYMCQDRELIKIRKKDRAHAFAWKLYKELIQLPKTHRKSKLIGLYKKYHSSKS